METQEKDTKKRADDSPDTARKKAKKINEEGEVVKLNVGGKIFTTTKQTLTSQDTYFKVMFSGNHKLTRDGDGCVFIDRSHKHFNIILEFLRTGKIYLPDGYDRDVLNEELEFYAINRRIGLNRSIHHFSPSYPITTDGTRTDAYEILRFNQLESVFVWKFQAVFDTKRHVSNTISIGRYVFILAAEMGKGLFIMGTDSSGELYIKFGMIFGTNALELIRGYMDGDMDKFESCRLGVGLGQHGPLEIGVSYRFIVRIRIVTPPPIDLTK